MSLENGCSIDYATEHLKPSIALKISISVRAQGDKAAGSDLRGRFRREATADLSPKI